MPSVTNFSKGLVRIIVKSSLPALCNPVVTVKQQGSKTELLILNL